MNPPRTGAIVDSYMTGLVAASADLPDTADVLIARKLREVELEFRQREKERREYKRKRVHYGDGPICLRNGMLVFDGV